MNSLSSQHLLAFHGKAAGLQPWLNACCMQGPGIALWGPVVWRGEGGTDLHFPMSMTDRGCPRVTASTGVQEG